MNKKVYFRGSKLGHLGIAYLISLGAINEDNLLGNSPNYYFINKYGKIQALSIYEYNNEILEDYEEIDLRIIEKALLEIDFEKESKNVNTEISEDVKDFLKFSKERGINYYFRGNKKLGYLGLAFLENLGGTYSNSKPKIDGRNENVLYCINNENLIGCALPNRDLGLAIQATYKEIDLESMKYKEFVKNDSTESKFQYKVIIKSIGNAEASMNAYTKEGYELFSMINAPEGMVRSVDKTEYLILTFKKLIK